MQNQVNLDRFYYRVRKVCVLVAAILILPALAYAQDNQGNNQIAALQAQVTALQNQVNTLQSQLAAVQKNNALALDPYVRVAQGQVNGVNGPHVYFTGANIHIVSGQHVTNDTLTGLGNLIIGYDEVPTVLPCGSPLRPGDRGGSHNLVIGRGNRFTQTAFGGLVAGEVNTISNEGASVSGGSGNTASGITASVSGGGALNTASGLNASVSGGALNTASAEDASVSGGFNNIASGNQASVDGGLNNKASGDHASVSGGINNPASGDHASVSGGSRVTVNTPAGHSP
jgi:hypothetical protein